MAQDDSARRWQELAVVGEELADHVVDLLDAAGIPALAGRSVDGLVAVTVPEPDYDRAATTVGLVLPGLLPSEPGADPSQDARAATDHSPQTPAAGLSDRLIRRADWTGQGQEQSGPYGLRFVRDEVSADEDGGIDDFVPPEPPPLPSLSRVERAAWTAAIGGPVLLLVGALADLGGWMTTAGLVAGLAGFGFLALRRPERPREGWDDGAAV